MKTHTGRMRRLEREKALYQYSSALERGDFETISEILTQAEQDPTLEQMVLEIHQAYQTETDTQTAQASQVPRPFQVKETQRAPAMLFGRVPRALRSAWQAAANWLKTLWAGGRHRGFLAAGGALLGVTLILSISWAIYTRSTRFYPAALSATRPHWAAFVTPRQAERIVQGSPRQPRTRGDESGGEAPATTADDRELKDEGPTQTAFVSPIAQTGDQAAVGRMIVRTGRIAMVARDTLITREAIETVVAEMAGEGAYVVSIEEQGRREGMPPHIVISIRVPVARFGETMDRLEEMALSVGSRTESGQDVTDEYVDLGARLETLEAARQRLIEIMAEASDTDALLKVEQQITTRETEIASIKGRMQYLSQSAQLSAIHIELRPSPLDQPVDIGWQPAATAREALETLLDDARNLGDWLIFTAVTVLPWVVVIGLVAYGLVRLVLWRVRARRKKE